MANLNETPSANRLHIGVYGRTNGGKSSLLNAFAGQEISIASGIAGTTTDPVYKAMEISPLGPCLLMDTAGFNDESELGRLRMEKTHLASEKTDIAVIVIGMEEPDDETDSTRLLQKYKEELAWYDDFKERKTPVLFVINKADLNPSGASKLAGCVSKHTGAETVCVSAKEKTGLDEFKAALIRLVPENFGEKTITEGLVKDGDLVMLVMPQDIQAPKGRLILPQVQTIRNLLDKKVVVLSVTTDKFEEALKALTKAPDLIITDSQVFGFVYEKKPSESRLTSFSVLFAAYKGDLAYYAESAAAIDRLGPASRVLIAECCSHAPLSEDIGRVKLPRMLRKRAGESLTVAVVSGTDFPECLQDYDLIIQCGACMFNRKYVLSRINCAKVQGVPMTNYGVAIAHLTGILDKIVMNG